MKALTVQQPWAWAIIHGGKDIENRTQQWSYRGPLAIHAGTRWSDRGAKDNRCVNTWLRYAPIPDHPLYGDLRPEDFEYGVLLGVVDLVDVHPDGESAYVEHGGKQRRRVVHLLLENARALAEPIPCKGALGLWTPPADIIARLDALG